jgi:phosphoribosylformylglycinamidine synthase
MKFKAFIEIMPHTELLDPEGKVLTKHMKDIDVHGVEDIRIGKHIVMTFEANDATEANEKVETACKKMLANIIMEQYEYSIEVLN